MSIIMLVWGAVACVLGLVSGHFDYVIIGNIWLVGSILETRN